MTDDLYKNLGGKIRELREQAGLTQGELAAKAGMYQTELSAFEKNGGRIRGADRINQILSVLGFELQIAPICAFPIKETSASI